MAVCSGISTNWLFSHCFQIELESRSVCFLWREEIKAENPEKNPRNKDENQQQIQSTCESSPGHSELSFFISFKIGGKNRKTCANKY